MKRLMKETLKSGVQLASVFSRKREREREREREGEREREREREKRIYVLIYELFLYPETLQHVGSTGTHDLICILGNVMSTKEGSGQAERRQRRRARWKY